MRLRILSAFRLRKIMFILPIVSNYPKIHLTSSILLVNSRQAVFKKRLCSNKSVKLI